MAAEIHARVLQAYGIFMVAWSVLEAAIEAALMKELGLSAERALIVTSSMQFRQRVTILSSLLQLRTDPPMDAIRLLAKIEKLAKRNAIVHGHIIVGVPDELTFVKSSVMDGYRAKHFRFSSNDLLSHVQKLNDETKRLQQLLQISDADMQALVDVGIKASRRVP